MAFQSTLRCLENVPVVGHLLAAGYFCAGGRSKAERAGVKATVGLVLAPVNLAAEIADEATRKRPNKLESEPLSSRPDWMKRHRTRTLRSLCLPGAHQSGTFRMSKKLRQLPLVEGWSRCQKVDIYRQLLAGIRFLDIRVMSCEGGQLYTHADYVRCVKLRDVLTRVRDFVSDNPTEIVILHITNDRKSVDWSACQMLIHELLRDRLIPEHMKDLPIGDITDQGKNIAICGMTDFAPSWNQLQYRWPNKQSPNQLGNHMRETLSEMGLYRPSCLFWYKAECTPSSPMYIRSVGGLPGLVMASRYGAEKFDSVEEMASATNYEVLQVLNGISHLPFNILSIDYVHDLVIERIVKLNESPEASYRISTMNMSTDDLDEIPIHSINLTSASATHNNSQRMSSTMNTSQRLSSTMNTSQRLNITMNSSAAINNTFDFRGHPVPPVQVKETMA